LSATGNITGNYFIGNGSQLTGLPEGYGNADVAAYLPTYTGNLVSLTGNVTTTANVSANYFLGNGSQLTGLPESGISWTTQANTAPANANPGDFWYNSATQIKYQYVNDGTSNVWVDQSSPTVFESITTGQIVNANANGVGNIGAAGSTFNTVFAQSITTGLISATGNITGGNLLGTIQTAAQPSITSVGTLTALSVTGNITGGNLITAGLASLSSITKTGSNGVGNIGASGSTFNTVFAKATSAQYADLAENYQADAAYAPGTVVVFGGDCEITQSCHSHDTRVAGVVSTDPAFLMNSAEQGLPVALTGRVPCQVQGPVGKGDLLVTSDLPGTAQKLQTWIPGCVIGKSLEIVEDNTVKTIEISVGRF
jgi:mono/diheme cytochrome c family protein